MGDDGLSIDGITDLVEIGRGGFGVVYRGHDVEFGRMVAVKLLPRLVDEQARSRFDRERLAMGALSGHPNVVSVHRGGFTENGQPYLVMEYVSGGSLADRLGATGALSWVETSRIGVHLAGALEAAHRAGILHRDVKPANVFISDLGQPKLGDFGIARLHGKTETASTVITASLAHAPPEVVAGQRPDVSSDVYSLASTMYELATGSPAFVQPSDEGIVALLARITGSAVPKPDLPPEAGPFVGAVVSAMAKRPTDRPPGALALGRQLQAAERAAGHGVTPLLVDEVSWPPPSRTAPVPPPVDPVPVEHRPPSAAGGSVGSEPTRPSHSRAPLLVGLALVAIVLAGIAYLVAGRPDTEAASSTPTSQPSIPSTATTTTTDPPSSTTSSTAGDGPDVTGPDSIPAAGEPPTSVVENTRNDRPYVRVEDTAGAIAIEVPADWAEAFRQSSSENPEQAALIDFGLPITGLAIGATFSDLYGDDDERRFDVSGIGINASVRDEPEDLDRVLDTNSRADLAREGCESFGERRPAVTASGIGRQAQAMCGLTSIIYGAVQHEDNPLILITYTIQIAKIDDLEAAGVQQTLEIVPENVRTISS